MSGCMCMCIIHLLYVMTRQHQDNSFFQRKMSCLRWDSNPRHSGLEMSALPLNYQAGSDGTCTLYMYMYMYMYLCIVVQDVCVYAVHDVCPSTLYIHTDPVNASSLREIESALFTLCLDKGHPQVPTPPSPIRNPHSEILARRAIHGNGPQQNSCNRWFDSALQVRTCKHSCT